MAFKRDGDDHGWLDNLKKRRVDELFSADIPEDEALLMKNGRLCCLVCRHRPVFDTINMLAVHRKGKKHAANAEWFQAEKNELDDLREKRQQQLNLSGSKLLGQGLLSSRSHKGLMASSPYDPRVSKKKVKPHERRPAVRLEESSSGTPGTLLSTSVTSLPGSSNVTADINTHNQNMPQTISEYRKKQRHDMEKNITILKPYVRQGTTLENQASHSVPSHSCLTNPAPQINSPNISQSLKCGTSQTIKDTSSSNPNSQGRSVFVHKQFSKHKTKTNPKASTTSSVSAVKTEETKRAEQYLFARGGGWKKDWDGKWIKDEDAEFDSDEEPPDLP